MPPLIVQCKTFDVLEPLPSIQLPMGLLQAPFDALDKIPSASQMMAKLMGLLDVALMPVKQLLELVEVLVAVKNCIEAVPKAIMQLSPAPVLDCIKNLAKAFARLLSYVPPLSYARALRDVCVFLVTLIDEVIRLFQRMDALIDGYVNVLAAAQAAGDLELVQFANCGMQNLRINMKTLIDALRLLKPVTDILMPAILRLIPTPELQKAADQSAASSAYMDSASSTLGSGGTTLPTYPGGEAPGASAVGVPLPRISPVLQGLTILRNSMVMVGNGLSLVVGSSVTLQVRNMPTFVYI